MRATGEVGVSIKDIYSGQALQLVDEKGRVAIPHTLRSTLIAKSPAGTDPKDAAVIVIAVHETDRCLIGFDAAHVEKRFAALEARALAHAGEDGAPKEEILRSGMAIEPVPFDASGRFIMPSFPRKYAGIGKYAFFYGLGSHFEIWDPATLLKSPRATGLMKSMVEHYLEERGEKL